MHAIEANLAVVTEKETLRKQQLEQDRLEVAAQAEIYTEDDRCTAELMQRFISLMSQHGYPGSVQLHSEGRSCGWMISDWIYQGPTTDYRGAYGSYFRWFVLIDGQIGKYEDTAYSGIEHYKALRGANRRRDFPDRTERREIARLTRRGKQGVSAIEPFRGHRAMANESLRDQLTDLARNAGLTLG
jgi:hypothetical protein